MRKSKHFPVNTLPAGPGAGIVIMRKSFDGVPHIEEVVRSHRDGGYSFIVQEKGTTHIEIDFQQYAIQAPGLLFIHPDQVHRVISFEGSTIASWIMATEKVRPEYLKLLNDLSPANALSLTVDALSAFTEMASVCIGLSEMRDEKLYDSILMESCNTLVAMVASRYMALPRPVDSHSRYDVIAKAFRQVLEDKFTTIKSPMAYASLLNISVPYLNECVKAGTGHAVSYNIQQRVVLEAKRLLYHSEKSVKEIAEELGYDDPSYFSRLFTKVAGLSPLSFRSKNRD